MAPTKAAPRTRSSKAQSRRAREEAARLARSKLGQRIRDLRVERGLTLEQLGAEIGTDKGTMSTIERGETRLGDEVARLQRIATALGVPLSDLLTASGLAHLEETVARVVT